jgi:L-lactate dehydrogenase (cytochrome)
VTVRFENASDARRLARRSLPAALFDYVDGAAEDEATMAANGDAFRQVTFRPRAGAGARTPEIATTVAGSRVSMPVLLAPCGLTELLHPDGSTGVMRAALDAETLYLVSTYVGLPPEAFAEHRSPRWFQLYAESREFASDMMRRAAASGFDGLVVTMDTPVNGKRERDSRTGATAAVNLNLRTAIRMSPQVAARPWWFARMARTTRHTLSTQTLPRDAHPDSLVQTPPAALEKAVRTPAASPRRVSPFTWDDIGWIRDQWPGPLVVKALLTGEDAAKAVRIGADAVVISNHGGRQLDGAPATLSVLREIVAAVGGQADVLLDGGVRRGADAVKALALGARAVLIGRPYLFALAAGGEAGVRHMLEIFRNDLVRTLELMGCHDVSQLDSTWVRTPIDWG